MATSLTSPALRFAANQAILAARRDIAKASLFSTNFTAEAANRGETLMVPIFSEGAASAFNKESNNYGNYNGSVSYVPMTFNEHVKQSFGFGEKDFLLTNGTNFWEKSGEAGGRAVGLSVLKTISSKINKTLVKTSGQDKYTDSEGNVTGSLEYFSANNEVVIGTGDLSKKIVAGTIRGACHKANIPVGGSVLMLNGAKFGELLALLDANVYGGPDAIRSGIIPNLYGFTAIIENDELLADADEKLLGAIVPVNAIGIASRVLPIQNPQLYQEVGTVTDDKSGLALQVRRGGDWKTGDSVFTVECLFGAKLLQPTKIVRLVSEATTPVGPSV